MLHMADAGGQLRLPQALVEAAIRALSATNLTTKSDAMLRTFLAFKAVHREDIRQPVDSLTLRAVVSELFTLLPTPDDVEDRDFKGTITLRGNSEGKPVWLANDSYRGSFLDYAGPTSPGRFLFEGNDWRNPLKPEAVEIVAETLTSPGRNWPPSEALAVIALRNAPIPPGEYVVGSLVELALKAFGVTEAEWARITTSEGLAIDQRREGTWDPDALLPELRPPGTEHATQSRAERDELPAHLGTEVSRVLAGLANHGESAIVGLAGVPGTSKSHVARIAARAFASDGCLREIQFSPGYTYEEFMEGPRYGSGMEVEIVPGAFLDLNQQATENPGHQYVLLIEEFTRADLPRVLGELFTYVEYRGPENPFTTMYRRDQITSIASNLAVLATFNPSDRSAVNIDGALLRRMRILDFPPSTELLQEILEGNGVDEEVIAALVELFDVCRDVAGPDRFEEVMPFGHAVFASVLSEPDLYELWHEELKRMLVRPHTPRHELYDTIVGHYPWHQSRATTVVGRSTDPSGPA
jgi:MoxR-like ATPase